MIRKMRKTISIFSNRNIRIAEPEVFILKNDFRDEIRDWMRHRKYELIAKAKRRDFVGNGECKFYTSPQAYWIYSIIALSFLSGAPYLLMGVAGVLMMQILWILFKWTVYVVDNPKLAQMMKYANGWIHLGVDEARKTIQSPDAGRFLMANAMILSAPTGKSYFKYVLHAKMRHCRQVIIRSYNGDRFDRTPEVLKDIKEKFEQQFQRRASS